MRRMMRRTTALLLALILMTAVLPYANAAALKQGSRGTEVRYLQMNLIGLGYLEGEADSSYGNMTRNAVERFQADFGLQVDGSAGNATQTAVRNAVVRLQVELQNLGYGPGSADGHFGSKTESALRAFQKANGLSQTGTASRETWAAINAQCGGMRANSVVRKGSYGTQVKYLQQALIGLGFLGGSADGHYGSRTEEAVRQFQSAYGLSVDGSAGRNTMTALRNAVVTLQSDLARKGYPSGTINGVYGNGTKSAVKAYQSDNGINANGVAGPKTMQRLYGYAMGGADSAEEKTYKIWIDSLFQNGDNSKFTYGGGKYWKTVWTSGCGGVSMAMALNALKDTDRYTGQNVMQWFSDNGYYWGAGTAHEGIYKYPRNQGLNTAYCAKAEKLVEYLKKGSLAIALTKDRTKEGLFANPGGGHYVLVSGYRLKDGVDQVFVNNPLSYKGSRWFDLEDLMANVYNANEGYPNPFVVIYK